MYVVAPAGHTVSGERVDPELLAAFLDGTASAEEREAILRTLSRSKEAYAEFSEASAIHRDLENPKQSPPILVDVPPAPASRAPHASRLRWLVPSMLLAAAIAGIAIVTQLRGTIPERTIRLAQATRLTRETGAGALTRQLGSSWDQPEWSASRGTDGATAVAGRAFRAGVRYADFEIASQANDSSGAIRAATALGGLLTSIDGGAPLAESLRSLAASAGTVSAHDRATAAVQLRSVLGTGDWFDLGVWTETARVSVLARELVFFDSAGPAVAELRRIIKAGTASVSNADWRAATDPLRPLVANRTWSTSDLSTIDQAIRAAMISAAR
jgi:hypothetical protein